MFSKLYIKLTIILYVWSGLCVGQTNPFVETVWEVNTVKLIWVNYDLYQKYTTENLVPGAQVITIYHFEKDKIFGRVVDSLGHIYSSNTPYEDMPYIRYRILFTESQMYAWLIEGKQRYFVTPYQVNDDSLHIIHPSRSIDIDGPYIFDGDSLIIEENLTSPTDVYYYRQVYTYNRINTGNINDILNEIKKYREIKGFDLRSPQDWP
jgi:hypothetical protein